MPYARPFEVSAETLAAQAEATLADLKAPAHKDALHALAHSGLDATSFVASLEAAHKTLASGIAHADRVRADYHVTVHDAAPEVDAAIRWLHVVQQRARVWLVTHPADRDEWSRRLRFGKLHNHSAQRAAHELLLVLHDAEPLAASLAKVGVDKKSLDAGRAALAALGVDARAKAASLAELDAPVAALHDAMDAVAVLLKQLAAASEAEALAAGTASAFPLAVVHAAHARAAAAAATLKAHPPASPAASPTG
jgi:hypothetical protein